MAFIEHGQELTGLEFGQHIVDSHMIQFDPTTMLNWTGDVCMVPAGLSGKVVLAEECAGFVFEHCAGRLRFFMVLSIIFLYVILTLMYRHDYFKKEIDFIKKEFKELKSWLTKKQCKK